jgi:hypothetical protein
MRQPAGRQRTDRASSPARDLPAGRAFEPKARARTRASTHPRASALKVRKANARSEQRADRAPVLLRKRPAARAFEPKARASTRASALQVRERTRTASNARIGRPGGRTWKRPKELVGTGRSTGPEATASRSPWSPPGSSLDDLTTFEPGSRDRSEDRSPVRSGGSHLPLRARRNVRPGPGHHKALVHELAPFRAEVIPELPTTVDALWIHSVPGEV